MALFLPNNGSLTIHQSEIEGDETALPLPPSSTRRRHHLNLRERIRPASRVGNSDGLTIMTCDRECECECDNHDENHENDQPTTIRMSPPPPPPIQELPEPSLATKLLLSDLFSQKAVMRNLTEDTIQAVMISLAAERTEQEERHETELANEEASTILAHRLVWEEEAQQSIQVQPLPCLSSSSSEGHLRTTSSRSSSSSSSSSSREDGRIESSSFLFGQFGDITTSRTQQQVGDSNATTTGAPIKKDKSLLTSIPKRYLKQQAKQPANTNTSTPGSEARSSSNYYDPSVQCLVCHRSTTEHRKMRCITLPCGHAFCRSCILTWLAKKNSCPYCRKIVERKKRVLMMTSAPSA